jgi:hypothetical protein
MIGLDIKTRDGTEEERSNALDAMPTTWLEAFGTTFSLASENSPYESIKRFIDRSYASYEEDEVIPMAELNQQYAGLGLTFLRDEKKGYVDLMVKKKKDDFEKQNIISRGPQNVLARGTYFLSGLGGSFTDPINIGTSVIPFMGQGRFLQMVGKYGTTRARFYRGVQEGAIGNTLFEPIEIALSNAEQRDYGAMDSLYNVAFGAILGGGLQVGFGKIGDVYKKYTGRDNIYQDIDNAPPELKEDLIKYSVGQLLQGKRINVAAFIEETKLQRNREIQLQKVQQMQLKGNLNVSLDTQLEPTVKSVAGIDELRSLLKDKIDSNIPKEQKIELEKLKKQYDELSQKASKRKLELTTKKIAAGEKEIDLNIINKDKKLIPIVAKINYLNKKMKKIQEFGEETTIKNFLEQQKLEKQKLSEVSQSTLSKLENLKQVYGNAAGLELTPNTITDRARKIDLSSKQDLDIAMNLERNILQGADRDIRRINTTYTVDGAEKIIVDINPMLIKKVDIDNLNQLQAEIKTFEDQSNVIENFAKNNPAFSSYLESFNLELKGINNNINKQDDVIKAIQAGVSCITRKGA